MLHTPLLKKCGAGGEQGDVRGL